MAVPSMLIVAPNGIVNDETSRETPSSESFSRFRGIVAFDVEDENAKNITEMNFLKNLTGFNLVNITSNDGYTTNACIARPKSTHKIYFPNGSKPPKPNDANVLAIKQKIPIGANFMTIRVISIMMVFAWVKKSLTTCVFSLNLANIIPISMVVSN